MRECPKCQATVDGVKCHNCGYQEGRKSSAPEHDPDWWRCCHTILGQRCANAGSLSDGTHGKGQWYCRQHYPGNHGRTVKASPPPGGFVSLKQAAGMMRMREPGEDD